MLKNLHAITKSKLLKSNACFGVNVTGINMRYFVRKKNNIGFKSGIMFYGLTRPSQAYQMAKDVVSVLGGGKNAEKLLLETAMQETKLGAYRDPTKDGAGRGITQFDKIGVEDVLQRCKQSERDLVLEAFGIDVWMLEHNDLDFAPLPCFILTRLKYKRIPEPIPNTIEGRASYWKKHYNTEAGRGTTDEYIINAKRVVDYKLK